jgi:hypothetical protein
LLSQAPGKQSRKQQRSCELLPNATTIFMRLRLHRARGGEYVPDNQNARINDFLKILPALHNIYPELSGELSVPCNRRSSMLFQLRMDHPAATSLIDSSSLFSGIWAPAKKSGIHGLI